MSRALNNTGEGNVKRLAVSIWTAPEFKGSREEAERIARRQVTQTADLFAGHMFDLVAEEPPPTDPNQTELF